MSRKMGPMRISLEEDRFAPPSSYLLVNVTSRKRCYEQSSPSYRLVKGYAATKSRKLKLSSHDEAPGMCVNFYLRIMENIYTIFVGT